LGRALARAELIDDRGAAASSEEFFRSPEYLRAEGATHSLLIDAPGGGLVAPLIVREIEGSELRDAVSPYGYPGIVARSAGDPPAALTADDLDWSATGLVSVFVRGTATGPHALAGAERSQLQISDPARERKSRMSDRQQIRKNEASGYEVELRPGPDSSEDERTGFRRAYEETMARTGASERYLFDRAWFDAVLSSPRTWLVVVTAPEGAGIAAASIAALSDGVLHYFLSGTADEHLRQAPMKNLIVALQDLSAELGAPLNLGGGLRPGDGLEEFKRGFANAQVPFVTHEIVCDRDAYDRLSAGRSAGDYFPAYRAPG
jgi:Acetyltransferase (GNAT) domain